LIDILVKILVYPIGLALLLLGIALVFMMIRRRIIAIWVLSVALTWLSLWSLPPVADSIARSLEGQFKHMSIDMVPKADVILVFGGVMRPALPGHPYPDLNAAADRVWHAARLYHAGKAPKVILSGGRNNWQYDWPTQAETMAIFLVALGVPPDVILLEEKSLTTYENAIYCLEMMHHQGMVNALLVTSALHMPRSMAVLKSYDFNVIPVATDFEAVIQPRSSSNWLPSAFALQRSTYALHEWIGLAVYRLRGWI